MAESCGFDSRLVILFEKLSRIYLVNVRETKVVCLIIIRDVVESVFLASG
jgi:hypothetical protein